MVNSYYLKIDLISNKKVTMCIAMHLINIQKSKADTKFSLTGRTK